MTQIRARVLRASTNEHDSTMWTFELRYPRVIHPEIMTYRKEVSRCAGSSRAIRGSTYRSRVEDDPFLPEYYGRNQSGMQADQEVSQEEIEEVQRLILAHRDQAVDLHRILSKKYGLHKQLVNRYLEPWSHIDVVFSTSAPEHLLAQRAHPDAEPHFQILAWCVWDAMQAAQVDHLWVPNFPWDDEEYRPNLWRSFHLPYLDAEEIFDHRLSPRKALAVSAARCARVSACPFGTKEPNIESDLELYERLVHGSGTIRLENGLEFSVMHLTPLEHQFWPQGDVWDPHSVYPTWECLRHHVAAQNDFASAMPELNEGQMPDFAQPFVERQRQERGR